MKIGAGTVAAQKFGAAALVDPRPYTVGKLLKHSAFIRILEFCCLQWDTANSN